jgi:sugar/nucleoside kinase (ribokinase family)
MTFKNLKALTLGSASIDVIASVDDDDIERMTMHNATSSFLLLEEGRKIDVTSIKSSVGGGGTNAAVALSRLGFETSCFIRVGQDLESEEILSELKSENIDTRFIRHDKDLPTGKAIMVTSHVCNPTIFTNRGANTALTDGEITPELFEGRDLVYIASLSGNSAACLGKIVRMAKEAGAFVVTNPGIRQLTYWAGDMVEALAHVDLISVNAVEAEQLALTLLPKGQMRQRDGGNVEGPTLLYKGLAGRPMEDVVSEVCNLGPKMVLITNGAEGAYAGTREGIQFHPAGKAKVGNTAGAGDAFATTFSAYASANYKTITCLKAATANAVSVIEAPNTHLGLLSGEQMKTALANE